ncbi:MAG: hypothetical protein KY440_13255 [Actinobacteria bacterium]|nr:hypothetical protein [Actinomycetota bacterium]
MKTDGEIRAKATTLRTPDQLEEMVEDPDTRLVIRALAVVAVFAVVAWPIHAMFGGWASTRR